MQAKERDPRIVEVNEFWLHQVGEKNWYKQDDGLDTSIRTRFLSLWEEAAIGHLKDWRLFPEGALAYLILTDQFPRNMFRGDPRSFATDARARHVAGISIARDFDLKIERPERQFFYLPFMHAESLPLQERAVRLFMTRMGAEGDNLLHARAHRQIIRDFGRFPYRNDAMGRVSSRAEKEFVEHGGYGAILNALEA